MRTDGARTWYFPDGYIPKKTGQQGTDSHEALMILNAASEMAHITIDIYFSDAEPVKGIERTVDPERVLTIMLSDKDELGGFSIGAERQYALRVQSDVRVVAQMGRADATQSNLSYYSSPGFPVSE